MMAGGSAAFLGQKTNAEGGAGGKKEPGPYVFKTMNGFFSSRQPPSDFFYVGENYLVEATFACLYFHCTHLDLNQNRYVF